MKKLFFSLFIFCFILPSCQKDYDFDFGDSSSSTSISFGDCGDECNEWERCVNISQDFFGFEEGCRPKLHLYTNHGNWDAEITIVDQYGDSYLYELEGLRAHTVDLQYINIDFPVNTIAYNYEHGFFPDSDTYHLSFAFIDSKTLEFTVNDLVYDPHVDSVVFYSGTGQLIHNGGSADAVIEFNCNYSFEGKNYSVSFSAIRYN